MWGRAVPAAPTPTHDTTAHPQQPTMDLISFVLQNIPCAIDYHGEPLQLLSVSLPTPRSAKILLYAKSLLARP